jgi:hypothetical protein
MGRDMACEQDCITSSSRVSIKEVNKILLGVGKELGFEPVPSETAAGHIHVSIGVCPMQYGGYFVDEQAEKAAKWDMVQERRESYSHKGALENEFKKMGKSLYSLASAFDSVHGFKFIVSEDAIGAINASTGARLTTVPRQYLSFENATKLIADYEAAIKRIAELDASLGPGV